MSLIIIIYCHSKAQSVASGINIALFRISATCIVVFFLRSFSFFVLQAKREGAEAGGLRAGGSRNAVYGDRVNFLQILKKL